MSGAVLLTLGSAPLAVSVSPTSAVGPASSGVTNAVTVSALGGSGVYTYLWEAVSGDLDLAPVSPTSATTAFSNPSETASMSVWRCRVSDGASVAYAPPVTAQLV